MIRPFFFRIFAELSNILFCIDTKLSKLFGAFLIKISGFFLIVPVPEHGASIKITSALYSD